ncbi:MAG TPA: GntR family transcriptional regulator [Rhizomicrobium sp.]|nr:GntR family transcriptional regulator [Rhizomicrobium sp.]
MLDQLALQDNGIPIYIQLRQQILALIGRGLLKPGMQVPTMRQVAVALKIDLNTVQRAYAELERDGVLAKQRGVGTFVTETPAPRNTRKQAQDLAFRVAAQAKGQGIALDELVDALARLAERAG